MHQAEFHLAEASASELRRKMSRPQSAAPHLYLHRLGDLGHLLFGHIELFERDDLVAHELAHPLQLLFKLGLGLEIPCHGQLLSAIDVLAPPPEGDRLFSNPSSLGSLRRRLPKAPSSAPCSASGGNDTHHFRRMRRPRRHVPHLEEMIPIISAGCAVLGAMFRIWRK